MILKEDGSEAKSAEAPVPAVQVEQLRKENEKLNEQVKSLITVEAKLHAVQNDLDHQLNIFKKLHELGLRVAKIRDLADTAAQVCSFALYDLNYERCLIFFENQASAGWFRLLKCDGYYGDEWTDKIRDAQLGATHPLMRLVAEKTQLRQTETEQIAELADFSSHYDLNEFIAHSLMGENGLVGVLVAGTSKAQRSFYVQITNEQSAYGLANLAGQAAAALNTALSHMELANERSSLEVKVKERTNELAQALNSLKELDTQKSNFFANVSHELRTPLTLSIAPLEEILAHKSLAPEVQERHLKVIYSNQLRLLKLINNLLDFAKLDAGKMTAKFQQLELLQAIRFYVGTLESAAQARRINLIVEADEDRIPLYLDRDKFEKVIMNLLSNAFKFTPDQGQIAIRVKSLEKEVHIAVSDTGIGIPKSAMSKLFQRFMQVDNSERRQYEGTGIGLALVKEYAAIHGGSVTVESEEGKGTTFLVTIPKGKEHLAADAIVSESQLEIEGLASHHLADFRVDADAEEDNALNDSVPAADAAAAVDSLEQGPTSTAPSSSPPGESASRVEVAEPTNATVLVVDDVADMRRFVAHILSAKYKVKTARDGLEGLEAARKIHPHIIVSDVMMPRMTGYELCNAIKKEPGELSRTPVILLSAKGDMNAKLQGLEHGADDYLVKPFNADELLTRVRNLIHLRVQEQALYQTQLQLLESQRKLLEGELTFASQVQSNILPRAPELSYEGLSLSGFLISASACSGDFWLYRRLPDDRTVVLLADVTGHGAGSAMVTELAYGALNAMLRSNANIKPAHLLNELNSILASESTPLWMTMAVGLLDPSRRCATWSNAGHAPILCRQPGMPVTTISSSGSPLGSDATVLFKDTELSNIDGPASFLLYSDGLLEASNPNGSQFGMRRLSKSFQRTFEPKACLQAIRDDLQTFTSGSPFNDDVSAVSVLLGGASLV